MRNVYIASRALRAPCRGGKKTVGCTVDSGGDDPIVEDLEEATSGVGPLLLFLLVCAYLFGGAAAGVAQGRKTSGGLLQLHPHAAQVRFLSQAGAPSNEPLTSLLS